MDAPAQNDTGKLILVIIDYGCNITINQQQRKKNYVMNAT